MIYYLAIGERLAATHYTQALPDGLTAWVSPIAMGPAYAADQARELGVPRLAAPYPDPIYANARAYRRVHLELLAGIAGIDELLFDQGGYGLLAVTPDLVVLRPEHAEELTRARLAFTEQHPDARPAHAGPDWPALEAEPPLENQVLDLLLWLEFWVLHAIDQFHDQRDPSKPVIGNLDWQNHPLGQE